LTNIHRLYDLDKRKAKKDAETYSWVGPAVSKGKALDTGEALQDRITSHKRLMVLNDEAHHVWDPDSAWNEAIGYLHDTIRKRTGGGFWHSLIQRHAEGQQGPGIQARSMRHTAWRSRRRRDCKDSDHRQRRQACEQMSEDASFRYEQHLRIGYERWRASQDEWKASSKKPLLFVMCEDTKAADDMPNVSTQIAPSMS